jgi:hypothetical protein
MRLNIHRSIFSGLPSFGLTLSNLPNASGENPVHSQHFCNYAHFQLKFLAEKTLHFVPRLLDVAEGSMSVVIGAIYMEMPLKPNILNEISEDVNI